MEELKEFLKYAGYMHLFNFKRQKQKHLKHAESHHYDVIHLMADALFLKTIVLRK